MLFDRNIPKGKRFNSLVLLAGPGWKDFLTYVSRIDTRWSVGISRSFLSERSLSTDNHCTRSEMRDTFGDELA